MKISLITSVYNTEKYLDRCFSSIVKQTYNDFEVIIINDGSTDNSQLLIEKYIKKDNRFRTFYEKNSGQAVARNKGLELAKGEYIVFVDSDDELKPDYLLNLSKTIEDNRDFGYAKMERVYEYKPNIIEKNFKYIHYYSGDKVNIYDDPSIITSVSNSPCSKIFRKQFLLDNKIMFYPNRLYEDLLFISSVLLSNPSIKYIDDNSYIYHIHKGSSMTGNGERVFEMFDVFDAVVDYAKQKGVFDTFYDEIEYLALYHVGIGTMFRYFVYKPLKFFYCRKKCKLYLDKYCFNSNNKYVSKISFFSKLYLKLFF